MNKERRQVVIGIGCLGAAIAAQALAPRRLVNRLGERVLADIIPRQFKGWQALADSDLAVPEQSDALAHLIYDQTITRMYRGVDGNEVMLLIAHGPRQTEALQLHRPETCYQAFGYAISKREQTVLGIAPAPQLPLAHFAADLALQHSNVTYWARIGAAFPQSDFAQRVAIIRAAVSGNVVDGTLSRVSNMLADPLAARCLNVEFIAAMLTAIRPADRAILLGDLQNAVS